MADADEGEKALKVSLAPGLETEEGRTRYKKAVEERERLDYEAYLMLAELEDLGLLNKSVLQTALVSLGEPAGEAVQAAADLAKAIDEILCSRRRAEAEVIDALIAKETRRREKDNP